jgi:hypothetical protein
VKSFQILGNNVERLKYITREKYEKNQRKNPSFRKDKKKWMENSRPNRLSRGKGFSNPQYQRKRPMRSLSSLKFTPGYVRRFSFQFKPCLL